MINLLIGVVIGALVGSIADWIYWRNNVLAMREKLDRQEREICRLKGAPYQSAWGSLLDRPPIYFDKKPAARS